MSGVTVEDVAWLKRVIRSERYGNETNARIDRILSALQPLPGGEGEKT